MNSILSTLVIVLVALQADTALGKKHSWWNDWNDDWHGSHKGKKGHKWNWQPSYGHHDYDYDGWGGWKSNHKWSGGRRNLASGHGGKRGGDRALWKAVDIDGNEKWGKDNKNWGKDYVETDAPTPFPTKSPTKAPVTPAPTEAPTNSPTFAPSYGEDDWWGGWESDEEDDWWGGWESDEWGGGKKNRQKDDQWGGWKSDEWGGGKKNLRSGDNGRKGKNTIDIDGN